MTKQHHTEEGGFQNEGRERLIAQQWALNGAGFLAENAPVRPELKGHDNPGDDPHPERDGKDFDPEIE